MSRPFRYNFILVLVALGTCLAAVSGWRYARASAPVSGPIVLISIDALRADRLSAYGYRRRTTPAIDTLAADGVIFEHAYAHVPQTFPSHAALLTGRLPFETGVRDGVGSTLAATERLLPEMLRDRGYSTAGIVSSFLLRKETGIGQGFTLFDADLPPSNDGQSLTRRGADSEKIAEHWLDAIGTSRAFLFLHLAEPHEPRQAATGSADLPASESTPYDAAVTVADEAVSRLVRYLKTHQLYDQSTIILVSDHGEGLSDHGEEEHGLLVYEEALRVPLIIKPPAGAGAGRRVKSLVQHIDLVPTILDLAKAPIPGNLRGRSLTPLFEKDGRSDDRLVYSESLFGRTHFGWSGLTTVTDGRYRFIAGPTTELYDLQADPEERNNISETRPEIAVALRKALSAFNATAPVNTPDPGNAEDRERFELLGYVGTFGEIPATGTVTPENGAEILGQYRTAVRLLAGGHWTAAIEAFQHLTALEPASADAWAHLAAAATRTERHDLAARAYNRVAELTPASPDGHLGAATALLRLRKFDEARQVAQQVVDAGVGGGAATASAYQLLARAALGRRNPEAARRAASEAEVNSPHTPVVAYVKGRIALEQRRYPEALEAFEQALSTIDAHHEPPLADLRIYAAESLLRADRMSEAEYLFLEQLKEAPLNPRALAGLAAVYRATGRTNEAVSLAQR